MANYFSSMQRAMAGMPKLPIAISLIALLIISLTAGWEDYSTNVAGYNIVPTLKVNAWVVPFVCALPQVGQIAFMYAFAVNSESRWKAFVALAFHIMDVTVDVFYKAHGQSIGVWIVAFFESEIIFTLGSEVALTMCLGLLPAVLPEAIAEMSAMLHGVHSALGGAQSSGSAPQPPMPPRAEPSMPQMPPMPGRDPGRPRRG